MRALFGILCLFSSVSAVSASQRTDSERLARAAEVRAVLTEIAESRPASSERQSHDLPDELRKSFEAWTRG